LIERQLGRLPMLLARNSWRAFSMKPTCAPRSMNVARKQAGDELAGAQPVEALTRFIEAKRPRLEARNEPDGSGRG